MKITLNSELNELAKARQFVRETSDKLTAKSLTEEDVCELQLAVTEVVTNIIRHSYKNESGHRIEVAAERIAEGLQIVLNHWGSSFDPQSAPPPVFDGSREGGFGIFIISNCVDFFECSTDKHKRNSIRLIKKSKSEGKK